MIHFKQLSILIFLFCIALQLKADEFPTWANFTIYSIDSSFKANIVSTERNPSIKPSDNNWKLFVYQLKPETLLVWSSDYFPDGYCEGKLSNDGQIFVYINDTNQAFIYTQDTVITFCAKDFDLKSSNYNSSHKNWLKDYFLDPNYLSNNTILIIKTLDKKCIKINIKNGKCKIGKDVDSNTFKKEFRALKTLTYMILAAVGFGIFVFFYRRFFVKNKR